MKFWLWKSPVFKLGFVLWILFLVIVISVNQTPWIEKWGQSGDAFGPLTCLFSIIAGAAAYGAMRYQRMELERMKADAEHDRHEARFFQLLGLLNDAMRNAELRTPQGIVVGREAFVRIYATKDSILSDQDRFHRNTFDPCVKLIHVIADYLERTHEQEREFYLAVLQSQFSKLHRVSFSILAHKGGHSLRQDLMRLGIHEPVHHI